MYFLNGGVGTLEKLRKPLLVNKVTYDRAQSNLMFQPFPNRIDPTKKPVWFRTKSELYIPYWATPEYRERDGRDPMAMKTDTIYTPYWMSNKSRAKLIQRPQLQIKPKSEVLYHLGTDEEDGLGKGFNPIKAITRAVTFTPTSFQPKKILGAIGSVTATVATGGLGPIIAPKIVSANSSAMKILGGVATAIGVAAGAVILGPAIAASLGPTLSSAAGLLGKGVTSLTGFMGAFNKLTPALQRQQASQLTPQQIADIESGRAYFAPGTGQVTYYQQPQQPGYQIQPGQGLPMQQPMYQPTYQPTDFGPPVSQPVAQAGVADMLGGMSPLTLGLLIGVPLVVQLMMKKEK